MAQIKEELTMENVQEFVEAARKVLLLDSVDPTFFAGMCQILDHASKKVQGIGNRTTNEKISPLSDNEILGTIEEFYTALSPYLGEMMHNSSRIANYDHNNGIGAGLNNNIALDGSYKSVIEGAHEFAHRFTQGDSESEFVQNPNDSDTLEQDDFKPETRSDFDLFFDELDSIYAEMLSTDYLEQKNGTELVGLMPERIQEMQDTTKSDKYLGIDKLSYLILMTKYAQFLNKTPLTEETLDSHKQMITALNEKIMGSSKRSIMDKNIEEMPMGLANFRTLGSLSHQIGFLLANHLHESVNMSNPQQAQELFRKMLDINSLSSDFNQEQVQLISQLGLPFTLTQEGKLGMTQDGVTKINDSFDRTIDHYLERTIESPEETIDAKQPDIEIAVGDRSEETRGKDRVKEQLLDALNNPVSIEKREEAREELSPTQEKLKNNEQVEI